jgi:hypothetical protein
MTWDVTTNVKFWVDANLNKVFILQHEHHLDLYFLSKSKHCSRENLWWNWTIKGGTNDKVLSHLYFVVQFQG